MKIFSQPWSDEAENGLRISAGKDMADIRAEVQKGLSMLWKIEGEGELDFVRGWCVTRVEKDRGEVVFVLGEGKGFHHAAPHFVKAARDAGYKIRVHVERIGMMRMWKKHGVEISEYILRG